MRRLVILGLATLVAGCAGDRLVGPTSDLAGTEPALRSAAAAGDLVVMTRNMYVGAPVEPILVAAPADVPFRVAEAWATLLATDFPTRAAAMADEIAFRKPHLIGLQEVSLLRSQFPSDIVTPPGVPPNPIPNATNVEFDFLAGLLAELTARGLNYTAVATIQNTDVEVPRFDGVQGGIPIFTDIRLTDFDVILARNDVPVANPAAANFAVALPAPAGINVLRGWTAVDATVSGLTVRFVNTHLEAEAEIVRNFQAQELMGILAFEPKPIILVGDLNTGPGRPAAEGGQATYDFVLSTGFMDTWSMKKPATQDGFTCCHVGDLTNQHPTLRQRIDLVLARGAIGGMLTSAWIVGNTTGDYSRYGVWPSDHAGVVARWVFPMVAVAD